MVCDCMVGKIDVELDIDDVEMMTYMRCTKCGRIVAREPMSDVISSQEGPEVF